MMMNGSMQSVLEASVTVIVQDDGASCRLTALRGVVRTKLLHLVEVGDEVRPRVHGGDDHDNDAVLGEHVDDEDHQ